MTINEAEMILNEAVFHGMEPSNRKLMLGGLYLSKVGYGHLPYKTKKAAHEALAAAVHGKPLTLRGYRDEFDPIVKATFPGTITREGWKDKTPRPTHLRLLQAFGPLSDTEFTTLIKDLFNVVG